jgi:hypothetical protein
MRAKVSNSISYHEGEIIQIIRNYSKTHEQRHRSTVLK